MPQKRMDLGQSFGRLEGSRLRGHAVSCKRRLHRFRDGLLRERLRKRCNPWIVF